MLLGPTFSEETMKEFQYLLKHIHWNNISNLKNNFLYNRHSGLTGGHSIDD